MLMSLADEPSRFACLPAVRYGTVPDVEPWDAALRLDLLIPERPAGTRSPVVLHFHGGGWSEGTAASALYPWYNPLLAANGFITAAVTYRLSRFAPFPAQLHDAKTAVRWVRAHADEYGIDTDHVGVWGDSAGGHLAALLGMTGDDPDLEGLCGSPGHSSLVHAVVARCAPSDFGAFHTDDENTPGSVLWMLFGGPPGERPSLTATASPLTHVRPGRPPFLLVHGTDDETVPYQQSVTLADALHRTGNDVTLHTVDGGHHNMREDPLLPWTDEPWTALGREALAFFAGHLKP